MTETEFTAALADAVRDQLAAERERHAGEIAAVRADVDALRKLLEEIPAGPPGEPGAPGEQGPPGPAGVDGRDGMPGDRGEKGMDGRDGKDGRDGRDGKDGIASRDELLSEVAKAVEVAVPVMVEKRVAEAFAALPVLQYRGVFREGESYMPGHCATYGGSLWHCNAATSAKPGHGDDWTLAVKRGRDGKEAVSL